jgi:hypothetical protein
MVPPKYVDELKTAPVDEVDFVATFFEVCNPVSTDRTFAQEPMPDV